MFAGENLYNALNVTPITNLLDAYGTGKALFNDDLLPQDFTGDKSINFYINNTFNGALDYGLYSFIVNCRANTYGEAMTIAQAVFTALNRVHYTGYYIVCSLGAGIAPADNQDNYNIPVEITLKKGA